MFLGSFVSFPFTLKHCLMYSVFFSSKFEMELVFPAKDPPVQTLPQLLASLATTLAIDPLTAFLKNMG